MYEVKGGFQNDETIVGARDDDGVAHGGWRVGRNRPRQFSADVGARLLRRSQLSSGMLGRVSARLCDALLLH